ncbi:tyrosine-type recombinase/integrase [Natrinema sp. 1APR25-10V2]|uniref:tyrosine-type recombinase/integrase n=1 Tax=Natrinema sp. 1APR25-10V2 TaxID=2951081 RepID=UPI002876A2BE|nr:tyrosine-type recombinase/integrase [Natrinema sp. 1APR25-10V2]MDS0476794.1 site-specific integrase [Natrinema sp. 1APR25-10V2]
MAGADPRAEVDDLRDQLRGRGADQRYVQYDADRDHLLKMSDNIRLVPSKIGEHRHLKLLRHTSRMAALAPPPTIEDFRDNGEAAAADIADADDVEAVLEEHGLLGAALDYRAAAEAIVRWINDEYANEHTNQDYRTALRSFGRYRLKQDEPPAVLSWIPTGTSNDFNPVPSERDLLLWEDDVVPMIDAAHNSRDKALFAVQFEAGLRSGELFDLRVDDVFDAKHTVGVHVDGKRGERPVHLIMAVPYLQKWLDDHPGDGSDYLWTKLSIPDRPSYNTWRDYFRDAADRAGVTKDVTPTNFRKANTRWLVMLGYAQPRIEDRQGRKRGSEHTARYMARFGEESNERVYARLHGIEVEPEEDTEIGPVECPRCHRDTPQHEEFCVWCHFALTPDATDQIEAQDDRIFASAAQAPRTGDMTDDEEVTTEDVMEARQLIREHPALRRLLLPDR